MLGGEVWDSGMVDSLEAVIARAKVRRGLKASSGKENYKITRNVGVREIKPMREQNLNRNTWLRRVNLAVSDRI